MSVRIWGGKHCWTKPKFCKNKRFGYSTYSHMNVHKNPSLAEDREWSRELDNHCQTIGQILLTHQSKIQSFSVEVGKKK